jgi:hypothetical protein
MQVVPERISVDMRVKNEPANTDRIGTIDHEAAIAVGKVRLPLTQGGSGAALASGRRPSQSPAEASTGTGEPS